MDEYIQVPGPILGGYKDRRKRGPSKRRYKPHVAKDRPSYKPPSSKRRIRVRTDIPITPDWTSEDMRTEIKLRRRYRYIE